MTNAETIPDFPRIDAFFETDQSVIVTVLGVSHAFGTAPDATDARSEALEFLWGITRSPGFTRPVRVHTANNDGDAGVLVVTPDGDYYDETEPDDRWPITNPDNVDAARSPDLRPVGDAEPAPIPESATAVSTAPSEPAVSLFTDRKSFIADGPIVEPAHHGWRGIINRVGARIDPGPAELLWRDDVHLVSQHWPGPRTVAIGNPKGSANKTPTTVMLSAVFARYGGAGVLAWDNNETRGSLAWRTQRSNHEATVLDLLPQVPELLGTGAQSAEMSYFAHHQPADKFDVLRSDQSVDGDHEVSAGDVEQIHQVAARYYRMIVMDSGNNERATNWRAMIARANVLVIPCTNVEDTAEAGARMLESLARRDEHSRKLAQNAVAIISKRTPGKDPHMERIVRDFTPLVRDVVTIPYDKALLSGVIQFDALRPSTRRAWLRAAAAVARGLSGYFPD